MFTKEDHQFIDFLFNKLTSRTDTQMIIDPFLNNPKTRYYQLLDDDSTCDHLEFEKLVNNLREED